MLNMDEQTPEQELWDDKGQETKPIFHSKPCGGRVYWIKDMEHRCMTCGKSVTPEEMEFSE